MTGSTAAPVVAGVTLTPAIRAQLSPAAVAAGEQIIGEIVQAVAPEVGKAVWAWYEAKKASGIVGWMESHFLEPIFTTLFGANPTPAA
jgi:hypothetical protein